jgi:glycosyltransferase family protein
MRLGQNIVPYPSEAVYNDDIMEWNWEKSREQHYNYPWELDCTLYRKEDVERLIDTEDKVIKNPNYLEAVVTSDNSSEKVTRKHMASNKNHGCAVVITVNRVQDSYQNGFDDSMETDIYSLDKIYNDEDNTLDIEKISAKENHTVHVESEYFILRKASKGYSSSRLLVKKVKNIGKDMSKFPKKCYNYVERRLYRNGIFERKIKIINTKATLKTIWENDKSFIRFGESEFLLMMGKSVPSQQYDELLANRLKEILALKDAGIDIGVPYYYVYPVKFLTPYIGIRAQSIANQRRFLFKHSNNDVKYIDAGFTQAYHLYEDYDFERHFKMIKKLLKDKDVTLICGNSTLERIDYKLLDVCGTVEYMYAPATEAYSEYDKILKDAITIDKSRLVCISLGPTAKPLAYDLAKRGYKVWDIGHLLKDYDTYMKKKPRTETEIIQFYMPD